MDRTGVLLINIGTPATPEPSDVGRYLKEFLMDPFVIDIPWIARTVLVKRFIVPRRSHQSSELYRKIWTEKGSPLLLYSVSLQTKLQAALGDRYIVKAAMRYGAPSISSALQAMKSEAVHRLIALPLYPQYSLAAVESSKIEFDRLASRLLPGVRREVIPPFYSAPAFLDAVASVSRPYLRPGDNVVFSFHGVPQRHVKKTDPTGKHCLSTGCCDAVHPSNPNCYRAQCFQTYRELRARLGLEEKNCWVGFQSRLGRTPWIQPFTDKLYEELPKQGVRHLKVLVPSFVADCLETLEEVQIRGLAAFRAAGGETLQLVPSLNDHSVWVDAIVGMLTGPERTQKSAAPQSWHPTPQ